MSRWPKLRASEWVIAGFFCYTALLTPFFSQRPRLGEKPVLIAAGVFLLLALVARLNVPPWSRAISYVRDWLAVGLTLAAFREMELFVPRSYDLHFENGWIRLDRLVLQSWHVRAAIESFGAVLPSGLELCYLLVYGVPAYGLALLYVHRRGRDSDRFLLLYLLGTLAAYALFPFFPSQPPRYAFPDFFAPSIVTPLRHLNLRLLTAATIHSGVFPSAHVSSAFSAAWALLLVFPDRKRYGRGMLLYSVAVSVATVYGRYHFVADVLAGFAVSLAPAAVAWLLLRQTRSLPLERPVKTALIPSPQED